MTIVGLAGPLLVAAAARSPVPAPRQVALDGWRTMDRDAADRAIVASTAALGRSLGLLVVAEGVESAASGSVLAAIGCDLAQGFHYSPPVPAEQVPGLVRAAAAAQVGVATVSTSLEV